MGQRRQCLACGDGGALENELGQLVEIVEPEFVEHVEQSTATGLVAGRQPVDVTYHRSCLPDVVADDRDQVLVA